MARNDDVLLWILGGLAVAAVAGGGAVIYNQTRGLRLNNPGDIRRVAGTTWQGQSAVQSDPDFVGFTSIPYGMRALDITLNSYLTRDGATTVRQIITRYAPPSENDTAAYIADVSSQLDVNADQVLSPAWIPQLADAIARHEQGLAWDLVPASVIAQGHQLAAQVVSFA